MILPLVGTRSDRRRFVAWASDHRHEPSIRTRRTLAIDLCGRAAIALDNALLYHELQDQDRRKKRIPGHAFARAA
jgi:GAF domain-containing protein